MEGEYKRKERVGKVLVFEVNGHSRTIV